MRPSIAPVLMVAGIMGMTACTMLPRPAQLKASQKEARQRDRKAKVKAVVDADTQLIRNRVNQMTSAVTNGNAGQFASLFADDGVLMPYNQNQVEGKESIYTWVQGMFATFDYDRSFLRIDDLQIRGSMAYARGVYAQRLVPKGSGEVMNVSGNCMLSLQKQRNGSWQLTNAIWTSTLPPDSSLVARN
jgi:uncharacterized protein (TIGR02246 family)